MYGLSICTADAVVAPTRMTAMQARDARRAMVTNEQDSREHSFASAVVLMCGTLAAVTTKM